MKISTFSIVVGNVACDAACKFCISKCTGYQEADCNSLDGIHWDEVGRSIALAQKAETTTCLLTGEGEPTLHLKEVTAYLRAIYAAGREVEFNVPGAPEKPVKMHLPAFPMLELQTNAIRIGQLAEVAKNFGDQRFHEYVMLGQGVRTGAQLHQLRLYRALVEWRKLGLKTIAISTAGVRLEWNRQVYLHHRPNERYPDLGRTVRFLHGFGFQVRICVMMQKGFVDSPERVKEVVDWCREHGVAQSTIRPIRRPEHKPKKVWTDADRWVHLHGLDPEDERDISEWVKKNGHRIYAFTAGDHTFYVYDINGQNLCEADCLTVSDSPDTIRTEILYPRKGKTIFHWQFPTSAIL